MTTFKLTPLRLMQLLAISCVGCLSSGSVNAQSAIEPITIVQTSDRIPLNPKTPNPDSRNFVYPNVIRKNGMLAVFTSRQFDVLEMIDGNGTLVMQQNIKGRTGRMDIPLRPTSSGINYVRLRNNETTLIQKVMIIE